MDIYNKINKLEEITKPFVFNFNNINGPFFEILNSKYSLHEVSFRDRDSGEVLHSGSIGKNCWISCNFKYFKNWEIEIIADNNKYIKHIDYTNSKVLICIDSKSLGDNLAWIPYVEEFRKKMNCKVVCSSFFNPLYRESYPNIEFIEPGQVAHGIIAQFNIGWYYKENGDFDKFRNPNNFRLQPMQKTASDVLGLEFKEIRPIIDLNNFDKENIVSIAIHATAQSKYWNNSSGWQEVVDYCKSLGYRVILLSREENGYMGNYHPKGIEKMESGPIKNVIDILQKSKLFIGIGSGLSWLSWACNTPTCIISGFSYDYTEPMDDNIIRISAPPGKCSGCFNTHRLDAGDWNWCPLQKGTERQFECSTSITSEMVINNIKSYL